MSAITFFYVFRDFSISYDTPCFIAANDKKMITESICFAKVSNHEIINVIEGFISYQQANGGGTGIISLFWQFTDGKTTVAASTA